MDAVGRYLDQPIAKEGACFDEAERIPLSGVVSEEWRKAVVDDKGRLAAARTLGAEPDDRAAKDRAAGPLGFVPTARSDQNAAGWFPANPDMTVPPPGRDGLGCPARVPAAPDHRGAPQAWGAVGTPPSPGESRPLADGRPRPRASSARRHDTPMQHANPAADLIRRQQCLGWAGPSQDVARTKRRDAVTVVRPRIMPSWFQPMLNCSRSTVNSAVSVTASVLASVRCAVKDCGRLMPRAVS